MNVLNILLLVLFASSVSAGCRGHHGENKGKEKYKRTLNVPLQAEGGVIENEYLIYHDEGVDPHDLLYDFIYSGDAEILFEYTLMNAFSVHIKRELLDIALRNIENIEIFDNPVVSAIGMDSPVYAWGVDRTDQTTGMNNQYQYERDGSNVDVYILDTGIFIEHEQFEGRASHGVDFTGEGNGDYHNHGTHVAGTFPCVVSFSCYLLSVTMRVSLFLVTSDSDISPSSRLCLLFHLHFRNCWEQKVWDCQEGQFDCSQGHE
jgi:hypothetical protein